MSDDQELTKLPQELIDRIAKDLSQWDDVAAEQHGDAGLQPWGPNSMSAIVKRVLTKAAKDPPEADQRGSAEVRYRSARQGKRMSMRIWLLWCLDPDDADVPYLANCIDEYALDNWGDQDECFRKLEAEVPEGHLKRWVTTTVPSKQLQSLFVPASLDFEGALEPVPQEDG